MIFAHLIGFLINNKATISPDGSIICHLLQSRIGSDLYFIILKSQCIKYIKCIENCKDKP